MSYSEEDKQLLQMALTANQVDQANAQGPNPLANLSPRDAALISGQPSPGQPQMLPPPPGPQPGQPLVGPNAPPVPPPMPPPFQAGQGMAHSAPQNAPYQIGNTDEGGERQALRPDMSKVVAAGPPPGPQGPPPTHGAADMQAPPPHPQGMGTGGTGAPVQRSAPAGWQETMAPAQRSLMAEGRKNEEEGGYNAALASSNAQEQQANIYKEAREKAQAPNSELEALQKQKQATLDHYEQLQRAAEKGPHQVDPNHYFSSKSVPERIVTALGLALGAFGASITHTENTAAALVQKSIDNDIQAQVTNIEDTRRGLESARGLVADKWRMFGDKEKAIAAAKQEQLQYVDMQAKELAARSGSAQALANYQVLHGQLQQRSAQEDATHNRYVPPASTGGASAAPSAAQMLDLEKKRAEIDKLKADTDKARGEGGKGGGRLAGEVKGEEQAAARKSILRDALRLEDLNKRAGVTGLWSPEARAEAESLRTQMALHYNPAQGIQRIGSGTELENLKKAVMPNLSHANTPGARQAQINAIKEEFARPDEQAPAFNVGSFKKAGQ